MDRPADPPDPEEQSRFSVVVERHRVRRPLGRLFWVATLVVPLVATGYVGWTRAPALEERLSGEVRAALVANELPDVRVRVEGRAVTALVPTGRSPQTATEVVAAVPGVLTVATEKVYASEAERKACAGIQDKLEKATGAHGVPFSGSSAALSSAARERLQRAARLLEACRAVDVVVGGHADSGVEDSGALSLRRARAMVAALVQAGVSEQRLEARGYGDQFEVEDEVTATARAKNQRGTLHVSGG